MRLFHVICLVICGVTLVACTKQPGNETDIATQPGAAAPASDAHSPDEDGLASARKDLEAGETYPFTFSGTDTQGNEQSLEALAGKVVIVDFWGTWCPPCRAEIPSFVELQEKYGDQGFQMIGLNYERKESEEANLKAVLDFAEEFSMNYPCILSDDETRAQVPNFRGYPTTLFIDRSGKVRMTVVGLHEFAYLEAVVKVLLEEEPNS